MVLNFFGGAPRGTRNWNLIKIQISPRFEYFQSNILAPRDPLGVPHLIVAKFDFFWKKSKQNFKGGFFLIGHCRDPIVVDMMCDDFFEMK